MPDINPKNNNIKSINPKIAKVVKNFVLESKQILNDSLIAEYLFGSYATNTQTPLSDIDILILVSKNTSELQWEISGLASKYSLEDPINVFRDPAHPIIDTRLEASLHAGKAGSVPYHVPKAS